MAEVPGRGHRLAGYSRLAGLSSSEARLSELEAQIAELLFSLRQLDRVDVTLVETAVAYTRPMDAAERNDG